MSANISVGGGKPEIAYVGEKPWHGLGTKINENATMDEVIEAAGLDWTVSTRPVFQQVENQAFREIERYQLIVRDDTQAVLGLSGKRFTPLQNRDAFRALDSKIQKLRVKYDVAGALGVGEHIWALAKLGTFSVGKNDEITKYLLLANSHDSKHSLRILVTTIRVVCQNTMVAALSEGTGKGYKGVHSSVLESRLSGAIDDVLQVSGIYKNLEEIYGRMLTQRMNKAQVDQYFRKVFKVAGGADQDKPSRVLVELSERLENKENTIGGMAGTVWQAFNTATEFCDHGGRKTPLDTRAQSILFGAGASVKQRAFEEAVALIR